MGFNGLSAGEIPTMIRKYSTLLCFSFSLFFITTIANAAATTNTLSNPSNNDKIIVLLVLRQRLIHPLIQLILLILQLIQITMSVQTQMPPANPMMQRQTKAPQAQTKIN